MFTRLSTGTHTLAEPSTIPCRSTTSPTPLAKRPKALKGTRLPTVGGTRFWMPSSRAR